MAPNRTRATEDSRSESSQPTSKHLSAASHQGIAKRAARAHPAANVGSNLRDVTSVGDSSSTWLEGGNGGINWPSLPTPILHAYRHAYRLDVPSAFGCAGHQLVLTDPRGLGAFSPSMARRRTTKGSGNGNNKEKAKVTKETLALAVRKDFNAAAVNETEVLTSFLYAVKNIKKPFRMRFAPGKK